MQVKIIEGCPAMEVTIHCPKATEEVYAIAAMLGGFGKKIPGVKDGKTCLIDRQAVLYFETVEKRCFVYTAEEVYETPLKLYEIEERLADGMFFRSAKSQIVNLAKIRSLCPEFGGRMELVMENGERVIVSRQYARSLKERLGLV